MLINKDRLSRWYAIVLLGWTAYFLLLGIPIFHFGLAVPIAKIASFAGIGCAEQLAITPWIFSARATPQNPSGKIARRTAALIVWIILFAFLIFYYFQRGWSSSSPAQPLRGYLFDTLIVVVVVAITIVEAVLRHRRQDSKAGDSKRWPSLS
jgi:hypothetical protein